MINKEGKMSAKDKERPIITLTTDFGLHDDYVGCMKGVILARCRDAAIIDLTHNIEAQNIAQAAMSIGHSYQFFSPGTTHIVVVDPGVGSKRSILALQAVGHTFIAPDNGILTPFLGQDNFQKAFILDNAEVFAESVSATFHGRDIMAPVAARLACGMDISLVGPQIKRQDCFRINLPTARFEENKIVGEIIHIDHFGNLRTSILAKDMALVSQQEVLIRVGSHTINGVNARYSDTASGSIVALFDSRGHVEIAVNSGSAAVTLGCRIGDEIIVTKPGSK